MFKSSNRFGVFIIILILFGFLFQFFLFTRKAHSEILSTSVQVQIVTTTTTTTTIGGGGGGGGGGYTPSLPPETKVIFEGRAYPLSIVNVLKDGELAVSTISGPDAKFYTLIEGLSSGNYLFSVYSEDSEERRSVSFTFPVFITQGVTTKISGIFISPTIDVDKLEVRKGEIVKIFGQTAPDTDVTIIINSDEEIYGNTKSDEIGAYLYNLDTVGVETGDHLAKSRATIEEEISPLSQAVSFKVGTKTVLKTTGKCGKADLNCDRRVNLVDFSIAAYWYKRSLSASFKIFEAERLNGDGKVDLVDFSIMAYYWTG